MGNVERRMGAVPLGSEYWSNTAQLSVTLYPSPIPTWKSGTMGSAAEGLTLLWNARKYLELPGITWE